jgi:hypothetical protein
LLPRNPLSRNDLNYELNLDFFSTSAPEEEEAEESLDFEQKQKPTNGQVVTHGDGGRRADH